MIMADVDWNRIVERVFDVPVLAVLLAILFVSLIAYSSIRKNRLKEKMLERGFSASEIEKVMNAGK